MQKQLALPSQIFLFRNVIIHAVSFGVITWFNSPMVRARKMGMKSVVDITRNLVVSSYLIFFKQKDTYYLVPAIIVVTHM